MRQTYRVLAAVLALGVLVQAASLAFGWFDVIAQVDSGVVIDENFQPNVGHVLHGMVGMYAMPLLALVLLIVSFPAARAVPGARVWAAALFLAVVLQVVLAFVAFGAPLVGILHGLNALVIFMIALKAHLLARTPAGSGARAAGAHAASGSTMPV